MKVLIKIIVLFFLVFLAAPTIVSLLQDDDTKTSVVYSLDEEELQKEIKEVKIGVAYIYEPAIVPVVTRSLPINAHNLQKHENVSGDIFLLPPEKCC